MVQHGLKSKLSHYRTSCYMRKISQWKGFIHLVVIFISKRFMSLKMRKSVITSIQDATAKIIQKKDKNKN